MIIRITHLEMSLAILDFYFSLCGTYAIVRPSSVRVLSYYVARGVLIEIDAGIASCVLRLSKISKNVFPRDICSI